MTKIKEKFSLKHAIIKEFLAEFLGIFVLIVSRLPVHLLSCCPSQPAEGLEEEVTLCGTEWLPHIK
jgi:hypothetical protein